MINREHFVDCSDNEQFCFFIACANCGFTHKSTPTKYAVSENEASASKSDLHQEEYKRAFDTAITEAAAHFKTCPICETPVCNDCTVAIGGKRICKRCGKALSEEVLRHSKGSASAEFVLFDKFVLPRRKNMDYHSDGVIGKRVAFIEDDCKSFLLSFDETMECLDLVTSSSLAKKDVFSEYKSEKGYIHQRKSATFENKGFVYFHIEFTTDDGECVILPGQLSFSEGYVHTNGVEPLLKDLLETIRLC